MKTYKTVKAQTLEVLANKVNVALEEGWEVVGGLCSAISSRGSTEYMQALITNKASGGALGAVSEDVQNQLSLLKEKVLSVMIQKRIMHETTSRISYKRTEYHI